MKKRFIFDENYIKKYAKRGRLKWLIIGLSALTLIIIVIIVILATRNNTSKPTKPAVSNFKVKEELKIEAGTKLPSITDYFDILENIDEDEIKITYPDEFELNYDTSSCTEDEIEEIYSNEEPNYEDYDCINNYLLTPATYGVTIELQNKEYTVNLIVEDTKEPVLVTQNLEIFEGEEYKLDNFVSSCFDVTSECNISYYTKDVDDNGNPIDYSKITDLGEHTIKIIATDDYGNTTDPTEAKLTILKAEGNYYTITFNSDGGSAVNNKKVKENGSVIEPVTPTKEGYNFLGWYLNDEKFDFNSKITSNITLTAKWEAISSGGDGGTSEGGSDKPGPINVSSISLNFKTIYLNIGETKTVIAKVYPSNATNKNVTWSSSNNSVATVSNGNITGVSNGTVTITATADGKSASVQVIVNNSGGSTSCKYGDINYNPSYILSVNLTENNCAIDPNRTPNESLSTSDYSKLVRNLAEMGINASNNISHNVTRQKIKNTSGLGLVGYQLYIKVGVIDSSNPYVVMNAEYILKPDGTRQFITNNICKNNICLYP